jgi:hypothetical protein
VFVDLQQLRAALPNAQTVTLCLDSTCSHGQARADAVDTILAAVRSSKRSYTVVLVARDRNNMAILRVRRTVTLVEVAPNGAACGSVCFSRGLTLNAADRRLELH